MDSPRIEIPSLVIAASQLIFTGGVTGYLYQPQVWSFCLIGRVYFDSKDRFRSGRLIRTSNVLEFHDEHGYLVAVTTSGSRYVLIDPGMNPDLPDRDEPFDLGTPRLLS